MRNFRRSLFGFGFWVWVLKEGTAVRRCVVVRSFVCLFVCVWYPKQNETKQSNDDGGNDATTQRRRQRTRNEKLDALSVHRSLCRRRRRRPPLSAVCVTLRRCYRCDSGRDIGESSSERSQANKSQNANVVTYAHPGCFLFMWCALL